MCRIREFAGEAVRHRDDAALARADRALRFIGRGHTAGEMIWLRGLRRMDDAALRRALTQMPVIPPPTIPGTPRLVALLIYRPECAA